MGRIWRITWKGRPLDTPPKIAGASVDELLNHLQAYENRTLYRARRELWKLTDAELKPALEAWMNELRVNDPGYTHHLTEALWLHQQRGWINAELFAKVATSPDYHARAAAAHLLRHWSEQLPKAREHFLRFASDESPKVRLEATTSASWADIAIARDVLNVVTELPQDNYLKQVVSATAKVLAPAMKNNSMTMPVDQLAKRSLDDVAVIKAVVRRADISRELRNDALLHLAKSEGTSTDVALVKVISEVDQRGAPSLRDWLAILDQTPVESRSVVEPLLTAHSVEVREAGYAAWFRQDPKAAIPQDSPDALRSIARLKETEVRGRFYEPAKQVLSESGTAVELRQAAGFALGHIPGKDEEIFDLLANYLGDSDLTATVATALLNRPQDQFPQEGATKLLNNYLPILSGTPVEQRGETAFSQSSILLTGLANKLDRPDVIETIAKLQLVPIEIATVPDQLKFDQKSLHVPPGTPIELQLDNPDGLMHNLVICAPGSLDKVGTAVDALIADADAMRRDWIPDIPEVLFATPMAQGKQEMTLRFTSPDQPGKYPFLCTVPGHWRVMQGELIVSKTAKKESRFDSDWRA